MIDTKVNFNEETTEKIPYLLLHWVRYYIFDFDHFYRIIFYKVSDQFTKKKKKKTERGVVAVVMIIHTNGIKPEYFT